MTPLRQRMIEDLQLKGYSDSTQTLYVDAVRHLCDHFGKSPGKITEEDLRDYFLYGKNVKKWSRSTSTVALCGIKFFYENTIKRPWPTLLFIRPGREKKLPVVLSRDEVREILSNIKLLKPVKKFLSQPGETGLKIEFWLKIDSLSKHQFSLSFFILSRFFFNHLNPLLGRFILWLSIQLCENRQLYSPFTSLATKIKPITSQSLT